MKKKIAFISLMTGSPWGGSEELWSQAAENGLKEGYHVFISSKDWGDKNPTKLLALKDQGASLQLRNTAPRKKSLFAGLSEKYNFHFKRNEFVEQIESFDPEILVVNQGGSYDILYTDHILKYIQATKKPFFLICQFNEDSGIPPVHIRDAASHLYSKARHIFFVAHRNKTTCQRQIINALDNSSVIQNPINFWLDHHLPWVTESTTNFACVARLDCNFKGQDILVEALSHKYWKDKSWHLNIYGSGKDEGYLKNLAIYFGLEKKISFHGEVKNIREVWKSNHILLMPSIAEGTPLTLMESMMCSRPSVVTDVGGNADMVDDGKSGFISPACNPVAFHETLKKAWEAKDSWEQMGKNAYAKIIHSDPEPGRTLFEKIIQLTAK